MNEHLVYTEKKRLERVAKALEANNMQAFIVDTKAEIPALVETLLQKGETVYHGGSMTLNECGVADLLKNGNYNYVDRDAPGVNKTAIDQESIKADTYFASSNAITEQGELYNVDGYANRVAALAFGPKSVVVIAGRNKIVSDIEAARRRNREVSAPANAHRLSLKTPCATTGICADCRSPERICCAELTLKFQRIKNRIKVILVMEEMGF